ncbi:hypothetical protein YC2023_021540 [Brassica napus]
MRLCRLERQIFLGLSFVPRFFPSIQNVLSKLDTRLDAIETGKAVEDRSSSNQTRPEGQVVIVEHDTNNNLEASKNDASWTDRGQTTSNTIKWGPRARERDVRSAEKREVCGVAGKKKLI